MRTIKMLSLIAVALLAAAASVPAEAHGRLRVGVGFAFGVPVRHHHFHPAYYYAPYPYYYAPYPYYPAPVVVRTEPTAYVERGDGSATAERSSQDYWYYCAESKAYHPYVKHCPGGWQKQVPTPPPGE